MVVSLSLVSLLFFELINNEFSLLLVQILILRCVVSDYSHQLINLVTELVHFGAEIFVSFLLRKSTKMVTVSFQKKCHLAGVSPHVYHLEQTLVWKRIRWRWAQRDVEAKINNIFNLLAVVAIKLNIDPSMFFPIEFEPIGSIDEETPDVEDGDIIKGRITDFRFSDDNSTNGCFEMWFILLLLFLKMVLQLKFRRMEKLLASSSSSQTVNDIWVYSQIQSSPYIFWMIKARISNRSSPIQAIDWLNSKGMDIHNECPLCKDEEENVDHLHHLLLVQKIMGYLLSLFWKSVVKSN